MTEEEHIDLGGISSLCSLTSYMTHILVWRLMHRYEAHSLENLHEWVVDQTEPYQIDVANLTSR